MSNNLALGTDAGIFFVRSVGGRWQIEGNSLEDRRITCLAAFEDILISGSTNGIFRSTDSGRSWQEIDFAPVPHARWLTFHPDLAGVALLGTEPAALFISLDSGLTWRECQEVADLRDRYNWFLPYSPEAGCVRGFAGVGNRLYAAVEVGGLLASTDAGRNWGLVEGSDGIPRFGRPAEGFIHPDVHSVEVNPASADQVFAPTGGGFFYSENGGQRWELGHPPCYCRAVWVDPDEPGHLILGPADSVDRNGSIVESRDKGRSWQPADQGLDTPWPTTMVERFAQVGSQLVAILSDGRVLAAELSDLQWQPILPDIGYARCLVTIG